MAETHEECGVAAVVLKKDSDIYSSECASKILSELLSQLQHRGQTSAGIAVYNKNSKKILKTLKAVGKVSNLFRTESVENSKKILNENCGTRGIGHVRYATSNVSNDEQIIEDEAQPFFRRHGRLWKRFAIAFNGHLTNYDSLREDLEKNNDYVLDTDVDTEVLMHLIALSLNSKHDIRTNLFEVIRKVFDKLDGSFSFVFLDGEGNLILARDRLGLRPLVFGENKELIAAASESNALLKVEIENFRDVKPGEIVWIKPNGEILSDSIKIEKTAHCHFEYIYFSDACSKNDGLSVDLARCELGRQLAREERLKERFSEGNWIVIPVPSTATPAAMAYSEELKIPISLALLKNDVGRGFINSKEKRNSIMDSKYNVISTRTAGKKIILIDDSIVRGETSSRIVKLLKERGGAAEVHLRTTEAPIKFPCCYGVDFHCIEELIAGNFSRDYEKLVDFVANKIGADSVGFISLDGLKKALGGDENKFCFACLTGRYPTLSGEEFLKKAINMMRGTDTKK